MKENLTITLNIPVLLSELLLSEMCIRVQNVAWPIQAGQHFVVFHAGKSPYLMFTNRHEIRRIDLLKRDYTQVVPTQKNAVAIAVDVTTNRMFWCDRFHRKIYRWALTCLHPDLLHAHIPF